MPGPKTKFTSQQEILKLAQLIEPVALREIERESQQRRRSLESLYQRLCRHAAKLEIDYPRLSTFYRPQQYLDNTRAIVAAVGAAAEGIARHQQNAERGAAPEAAPVRQQRHKQGQPRPALKPLSALSPAAREQRKNHFRFHAAKLRRQVRGSTNPQEALHLAERERLYLALAEAAQLPAVLERVSSSAQVDLLLDAKEAELQAPSASALLTQAHISPEAVAEAARQLRSLVPAQDAETQVREAIVIHENCLTRAYPDDPRVAALKPALVRLLAGQIQLREGQQALEVDAGRGEVADLLAQRYPQARLVALERRPLFQELLALKAHRSHFVVMEHRLETIPACSLHVLILAHLAEEPSQERGRLDIAYQLLLPGGKLAALVSASAVAAWTREERVQWLNWLMKVGATVTPVRTKYAVDYARKPLYLVVARKPDIPTDTFGGQSTA
jgi:hypothetical protein